MDLERFAKQAAQSRAPLLILGELGVGKKSFARRLHFEGPQKSDPFVAVNCAFEPLDGAGVLGRLKAAQSGSLFLDGVGSLSMEAQEAVLKAILEGTTGQGGARILCAESRDLEIMVGQGNFLEPLFNRIGAAAVRIPPLRERKDDIMPLAELFLNAFSAETKKSFEGFSDEAKEALLAYDWPGNVRELKNSVERACLLGKPPLAGLQDFLPFGGAFGSQAQGSYVPQSGMSLKDAMNGFKKFYVERALRTVGKNQAETAASLGIQRTYLSRLLVELGIR